MSNNKLFLLSLVGFYSYFQVINAACDTAKLTECKAKLIEDLKNISADYDGIVVANKFPAVKEDDLDDVCMDKDNYVVCNDDYRNDCTQYKDKILYKAYEDELSFICDDKKAYLKHEECIQDMSTAASKCINNARSLLNGVEDDKKEACRTLEELVRCMIEETKTCELSAQVYVRKFSESALKIYDEEFDCGLTGLSDGDIAAIAIGSVAGFAVVVVIIYFAIKSCCKNVSRDHPRNFRGHKPPTYPYRY